MTNTENITQAAEPTKIKTDCFAYDGSKAGDYRCSALSELYCKNEKCSFYKPRSESRK